MIATPEITQAYKLTDRQTAQFLFCQGDNEVPSSAHHKPSERGWKENANFRSVRVPSVYLRSLSVLGYVPGAHLCTHIRPSASSSPIVIVPNPDRTDTGCVRSGAANFLLKREKADAPEQQIELRRAATPQNRSVPDVSLFYV